jgi:hypothetical protein
VDLHDKWRVLTGERKRNRSRNANVSPVTEADPNQLLALQAMLPAGLEGQMSADFLASLHHGDLFQDPSMAADLSQLHAAQAAAAAMSAGEEHGRNKRVKKMKEDIDDEDEIAAEMLKLTQTAEEGVEEVKEEEQTNEEADESVAADAIEQVEDVPVQEEEEEVKPQTKGKRRGGRSKKHD